MWKIVLSQPHIPHGSKWLPKAALWYVKAWDPRYEDEVGLPVSLCNIMINVQWGSSMVIPAGRHDWGFGCFFFFNHQITAILLEKENKNNSWVLIPALKCDNFLEVFASLALSKASEGITAFSTTRFLSEMQVAGESRSPVSIFSPSPAQITSYIRPIPKSKVLPFQDWALAFSYGLKGEGWPFTGVNQHGSVSKPTFWRL